MNRVLIGILVSTAVLAVGVAAAAYFFLGLGGAPPVGREVALHTYGDQTYVLVEYGEDLAIFAESGPPVTSRDLADNILHSYAWKPVLDDLDYAGIAEIVQGVERVDSSISSVRSLSNQAVDIFNELDSIAANIPFRGRISAMDVVKSSYPGLDTAEQAIRSLNSELNRWGENTEKLVGSTSVVAELRESGELDGEDLARLFNDASSSAQSAADTVNSVKSGVSEAQSSAGRLESALRDASDTPLIGGAIGGLASTAGRFESELGDLTSQLGDFEGELVQLRQQFQDGLAAATTAREGYMMRWLASPHDTRWPPTDPARAPAVVLERVGDTRQGDSATATSNEADSEAEPTATSDASEATSTTATSDSAQATDTPATSEAGEATQMAGTLVWSYETGHVIYSSPTVSGSLVYVGSYDDYLYAVDTATGERMWDFETGGRVRSSPAVSDGVVYVGSEDNHLYALDATTGELVWRFETGAWVKSSPTVSGGVVYVGSDDEHLYALEAATGELVWRYNIGADDVDSSPTVSGGVVYIGSDDDYVYALEAATGELVWRYKTGIDVDAPPHGVGRGGVRGVGRRLPLRTGGSNRRANLALRDRRGCAILAYGVRRYHICGVGGQSPICAGGSNWRAGLALQNRRSSAFVAHDVRRYRICGVGRQSPLRAGGSNRRSDLALQDRRSSVFVAHDVRRYRICGVGRRPPVRDHRLRTSDAC